MFTFVYYIHKLYLEKNLHWDRLKNKPNCPIIAAKEACVSDSR